MQIKDLFYELYGVEMVSINTHILPLKKKKTRSGKACGGRPTYNRANIFMIFFSCWVVVWLVKMAILVLALLVI